MTDAEQKRIFANNLTHYINVNGKQQNEVARAIGESPPTLNMWCKGKSMPSVGKIQKLADYFGIGKSDLTDDKSQADFEEMFAHIITNIELYDERFKKIIVDYYNQPKDKKEIICTFYEIFIKKEED
jgi:transcriptional regulator with XRE-family HTH domain